MKFHQIVLVPCISASLWISPTLAFAPHIPTKQPQTSKLSVSTLVAADPPVIATFEPVTDKEDTSLFDTTQPATSKRLQQRTDDILNEERYPVGSLPDDYLKSSMQVLNSWAKTYSTYGASNAERILGRLEREAQASDIGLAMLHQMHYAVVVDAWAKSGHPHAGVYADTIIKRLEAMSQKNPTFAPNRISLNSAIHAYSRQGNIIGAEGVFESMRSNPDIVFETGDYNALLAAYARKGEGRKAESLLKEMIKMHVEPDIISYNCILDSWSKSAEKGAAERAEAILTTLQQNYDSGDSDIQPNLRSYSNVAGAWARTGGEEAVQKVQAWLKSIEKRGMGKDIYPYVAVLEAWATSGVESGAEIAEDILLNEMEKNGIVNTVSYNTVIKAWQNGNARDAAQRAEAILERMDKLDADPDSNLNVKPDVFTYTGVIDCYAKSKGKGGADKAVEYLERMIDSCRAGNTEVKPNTVTLNCALDALAKKGAAEKAEGLLTRMVDSCDECLDKIHLNTISYTAVIDAYAKSGKKDAAQKAERILEMMEAAGNCEAKPNVRSFNAVMNAWVKSGGRGSELKAEAILSKMEKAYERGDTGVRPDVVSYSIVMNGWSKSKSIDAMENTQSVFDRMVRSWKSGNKDARPNLFSYVSLLNIICRSPSVDAAQMADEIVRQIWVEYTTDNESAKPNTKACTLAIDTWSKSGARDAGEKAEALLDWMIGTKDDDLNPNQLSFSAAVNAWAKSRVFGKAEKAKALLDKMVALYRGGNKAVRPNVFIYTGVINACAFAVGDTAEKLESFRIATSTFKDLCASDFGEPNHVTYGAYIGACNHLIPEGEARASTVEAVFKRCCEDGQLNDYVLKRIQSTLSKKELERLLGVVVEGNEPIDIATLPNEWRRNVREKRPGRRKG